MSTLTHTPALSLPGMMSPLAAFFTWSNNQQKNRLLWIGLALSIHGCILAPVTLLIVAMTGGNIVMWAITTVAMAMSLVVNLAALPTKITVPVFFLGLLLDLGVIAACFLF